MDPHHSDTSVQHPSLTIPHPTALTSIQSSLQHFLPSPALASTVNASAFEPNINPALLVTNLGQFLSDHHQQQQPQHNSASQYHQQAQRQQHQYQQQHHNLKDKQASPILDSASTSNTYYQLST